MSRTLGHVNTVSDTKTPACLTCKERKIACDRTSPVCQNCIRSKRSCQPYHVRLSWPKANDRKRAALGLSQQPSLSKRTYRRLEFINTSWRDVEMCRHLLNRMLHPHLAEYIGTYVLAPSLSLSNHTIESCNVELVPYSFGIDLQSLHSIIARLALLDDGDSSRAVLNSLLACADICKYGNPVQASRYIAAALSSLRISAQRGMRLQQGLQHIIAGILICSFEMHLFSQSSSTWLLYLSGTKSMIKQFCQTGISDHADKTLLFQWVFYYDTLARLGMKHWHGYRSLEPRLVKDLSSQLTSNKIIGYVGYAHKILELLSEFCSGVRPPDDPLYRSVGYISWLDQIEKQLISIRQKLQQHTALHDRGNFSEDPAVQELFVLATLVYFERKSLQLVGSSSKTDNWIEDAFLILSNIKQCNKPFPLFIFGLEARTDNRRLLILEIVDRTIAKANASGIVSLRKLLLKGWVQHDLKEDEDMHHEIDSCFFLGMCNFVPCLL